jgi:hypothetical protein
MASSEFNSLGLVSFSHAESLASNAIKEKTSLYVFLSELFESEWNDRALVMGEPVDPLVRWVA